MEQNIYSLLSDPDMKEIVESFQVETREILEKLDTDLIELEKSPKDFELLNQIFRSFHTIKGTSGFLGLEKLTAVTHKLEDILNKLRKGEIELNVDLMDGILAGYDTIKSLVTSIEEQKNENVDITQTVNILKGLLSNYQSNEDDGTDPLPIPEVLLTTGISPVLENEPADIAVFEDEFIEQTSDTQISGEADPDLQKETVKQNRIQQAVDNVTKKSDNTIRVEVDRLDQLLNIASELVLGRNRLQQVHSEFAIEYEGTKYSRDLADAAKQIDLMTNELQLVVMKTRMVKIGKVFNRFPRLVRDLSKETGKDISLVIKGEETELDKTLIEEINDPLCLKLFL